ncbi:hypothetical protein DXG03_000470 [Asterophora parasitica]|uniref:Mug135-like C-terminal domain-containing protein n=1 Tax=Asterophora parasitica TaxID=117018 RepID=A0A9P7KFD9_9AGAR|nr:hypothetical protein DXG03_000470 [Asterophora parasitica]
MAAPNAPTSQGQLIVVQSFPGIPKPNPPENPVTLKDIADAHDYVLRVHAAREHSGRPAPTSEMVKACSHAKSTVGGQPGQPTDEDLAAALLYEKQVIESFTGRRGNNYDVQAGQDIANGLGLLHSSLGWQPGYGPSYEDMAIALVYQKQVVESYAGPPLWFRQWDQMEFRPLSDGFAAHRLGNNYDVEVRQRANGKRATGHNVPFEIVPFRDGTDPTAPPHGLPALHSIDDIRTLNVEQVTAYCTHYGLDTEGSVEACQGRIAKHIGYSHS